MANTDSDVEPYREGVVIDEMRIYDSNYKEYSDIGDYINSLCRVGLVIVHLNIGSLRKNWDLLLSALDDKNSIDIIVLTEINIAEHENQLYKMEGYDVIFYNRCRRDRDKKRGGGICVYIKDNIVCDNVESSCNPNSGHEMIQFCLTVNDRKIEIFAIYRPPDENAIKYVDEMDKILADISNDTEVIIIGDMNIDLCGMQTPTISRYTNMMAGSGMENCIFGYTRVCMRDNVVVKSSIDHIHVRSCKERYSAVIQLHISDHYMVALGLVMDKDKNVNGEMYGHREVLDEKYIKNKLNNLRFDDVSCCGELGLNSETDIVYNYIRQTIDEIYKQAKISGRDKRNSKRDSKSWMTGPLLKKIKDRDIAFKKWKSNITNELYRSQYKQIRNKVNTDILKQKNEYISMEIDKVKGCIKKTWNKINEIIGRKGRENICDKIEKHLLKKHCDWSTVLNFFADEFTKGVSDILHKCDIKMESVNNTYVNYSMFLPKLNISSLKSIINDLKADKSPGIDNIRVKDVKNFNDSFMITLVNMINFSIRDGIIPDMLKIAITRPIFKSGKPTILKNYRPIAILPTIEKIMEKYISQHLNRYLFQNSLINRYQHGFQAGKSTTTLLNDFTDLINSKLNTNKAVIVLYIDYSKAFDTIDHRVLLGELNKIGIRGNLLNWFENYLNNRKLIVKVGDHSSGMRDVDHGVPQGSILGPILFTIYVNQIFSCVKDSYIFMYADDIALISAHQSQDLATEMIQKDFNRILAWSHDNGLVVNAEKTKVMCISTSKRATDEILIKSHNNNCLHGKRFMAGNCDCTKIKEVNTFRYLGLTIDNRFLWDVHVETVCMRLRACAPQMYKLQYYVSYDVLMSIYNALVFSIIRYGIICYGNSAFVYTNKIESIHKRIIKIMLNRKKILRDDSVHTVYKRTGILTVNNLFKYTVLVHNYYNAEYRTMMENLHNVRNNRMIVPRTINNYGERQFKVLVPKLFNMIPENMWSMGKIGVVKKRIKKWFLDHMQ